MVFDFEMPDALFSDGLEEAEEKLFLKKLPKIRKSLRRSLLLRQVTFWEMLSNMVPERIHKFLITSR